METSNFSKVWKLAFLLAATTVQTPALAAEAGLKSTHFGTIDYRQVCVAPDFAYAMGASGGCAYVRAENVSSYIGSQSTRLRFLGRKAADYKISKDIFRFITRCRQGSLNEFMAGLAGEPVCRNYAVTKDEFMLEIAADSADQRQTGMKSKTSTEMVFSPSIASKPLGVAASAAK